MKQIVVIGCGRFGSSLAITLEKLGNEVMVIDKDEEKINSISNKVTHAIIADIRLEGTMQELGVSNFDICIISTSSDYETSIIATVEAKKVGIAKIISKAKDDTQAMVLKRVGADRVVVPEKDMGVRLANNISNSNIIDSINLSDEYSLVEIAPIPDWIGKSILEADIRKKHSVNIVAIKNTNSALEINISSNYKIKKSDILLVAGKNETISKLVANEV
ncbi:putative Ktr system potassium uptake protein A [Tissierellia bacterium KA00581]|jgi:hypothetical protein|nr:putative Ktr system potassium uptake protein A [Tissierellia bacterium KA00581]